MAATIFSVITNLGDKFDLGIDDEMTLGEVKTLVREISSIYERSNEFGVLDESNIVVKLSVRGFQLTDDTARWCELPLDRKSISDGEKMFAHISVKSKDQQRSQGASVPVGASDLLAGRSGASMRDSKRGREEEEAERQRARMMEPMIDMIASNPAFLEQLFASQPQLKKILDENPQAARELQNPETLKQLMMSQIDPDQRRQFNQAMQLQLAQISNTPGGTAMLERYMSGMMQEPEGKRKPCDVSETPEDSVRPNPQQSANDQALPNPWTASRHGSSAVSSTATLQNLFQHNNTAPQWSPSGSFPLPPSSNMFPMGQQFNPDLASMFSAMFGGPQRQTSQQEAARKASTPIDDDCDYSAGLVVLLEMGFEDTSLCEEALRKCKGDVDAAVCYIADRQSEAPDQH